MQEYANDSIISGIYNKVQYLILDYSTWEVFHFTDF